MRILITGATGAIGTQLVPRLVERGHEVTGTTRREAKLDLLRSLGAEGVVLDVLDRDAVRRVVAGVRPEVIVHEATALTGHIDLRHFDRTFALTNRLRVEGTDNLLDAARANGVGTVVAQSYAGWTLAREGARVQDEDAPFTDDPVDGMRESLAALIHLERAVAGADGLRGIVLRYGGFYGPGTSMAPGGDMLEAIRARRLPIVGDGRGMFSFIHVADAADATVAAIERGLPGVYHVTDDEPASAAEWMPVVAADLGVRPPRHVPRFLARILAGEVPVVMMTEARGASNRKAKRELGWAPRHATWRGSLGRDDATAGSGAVAA